MYAPLPPARPLDTSATAAAATLLAGVAVTEAPASKPIGAVLAGQFEPGQALETAVELAPGKCYTAIAVGAPPIEDVDVKLVLPPWVPGGIALVMAEAKTDGPTAVLGPRRDCFRWAMGTSAPARLVMVVTRGHGLAAARLYAR